MTESHAQHILITGATEGLGHSVAATYAKLESTTPEEHVLEQYGSILDPQHFGNMVAELVGNPQYATGVAYGFRADAGIFPLDMSVRPAGAHS